MIIVVNEYRKNRWVHIGLQIGHYVTDGSVVVTDMADGEDWEEKLIEQMSEMFGNSWKYRKSLYIKVKFYLKKFLKY